MTEDKCVYQILTQNLPDKDRTGTERAQIFGPNKKGFLKLIWSQLIETGLGTN